jgi:hypothetical protein
MADDITLNAGSGGDKTRAIHRAGGSGPKTQVMQLDKGGGGSTESLITDTNPMPTVPAFGTRSDTYTTAANGTTVDMSARPCRRFAIQVKGTSAAASAWNVVIEGSLNNTQFTTILEHSNAGEFRNAADGETVYFDTAVPWLYFRSRLVSITLGSATNVVATIVGQS